MIWYLLMFLFGAILGVMCIAVVSAGSEQDAYADGYRDGYIAGRNASDGKE